MKSPICLRLVVAVSLLSCGFLCAQTPQVAGDDPHGAPPIARNELVGNVSSTGVPGPVRSFLRMAGISQKIALVDVIPLLARNIYMQGYEGGTGRPNSSFTKSLRATGKGGGPLGAEWRDSSVEL